MATSNKNSVHPMSADELRGILTDRTIPDKCAYLAKQFRQQEIALHDAGPILQLLRPLVDAARVEHSKAPAMKRSERHRKEAECWFLTTILHNLQLQIAGPTTEMVEENRQALLVAMGTKDWEAATLALGNQARIALHNGNAEESLAMYQEGLALAREKRLPNDLVIDHLNAIAELLYERFGSHQQALIFSDEAFALLAEGQHSSITTWLSFHTRGRIVFNMGEFEEGMRLWTTAQNIGFDAGQQALGVHSANDIITQLYVQEEYTLALEYARSNEALISPLPFTRTAMQLLLIIARILLKLNELQPAREKLLQALERAEAITAPLLSFQLELAWGRLHFAEGDATEARNRANTAMVLAERHNLPLLYQSTAVILLGECYQSQGAFDKAEQAYQQALLWANNNRAFSSTLHRLLATLYEASGDRDKATQHYLQVLTFGTNENAMAASERLAVIAKEQGDFQQALGYFERYHEQFSHAETRRSNNRMMMLRVQYRIDQLEVQAVRESQQKEQAYAVLQSTQTDLNDVRISLVEYQHQIRTLRLRLQGIIANIEPIQNGKAMGELRTLARDVGGTVGAKQAQWQTHLRNHNVEFHRRLIAKHPTLSPALSLLCDCIRSGMTTDTIISVLHISSEALNKRRHRLRKALGLKPNQQLDSYLQML